MMELIKQKKSIEKENCRLKEEASRQEEHVTNLGKRLVEEEMNGRRLGIEVQSSVTSVTSKRSNRINTNGN